MAFILIDGTFTAELLASWAARSSAGCSMTRWRCEAMDYGLAGRTFVITGAARGQGAAEAELLVGRGGRVIGVDTPDAEGKALAGRLTATGPGTMEYRHLDVFFS